MEIEQSKLPHIESSAHEKEFATPAWRHAEGFGGWAVTEKIDGCSLGIHVSTGAFRLSSHECMLEEGEDFYRILQLKDLYRPLVEAVQKALQRPCAAWRQITLHGEYFGPRIMGRIVYGKTRSIRLFGGCSIEPAEEAACFLVPAPVEFCRTEDLPWLPWHGALARACCGRVCQSGGGPGSASLGPSLINPKPGARASCRCRWQGAGASRRGQA